MGNSKLRHPIKRMTVESNPTVTCSPQVVYDITMIFVVVNEGVGGDEIRGGDRGAPRLANAPHS